MIYVNISFQRCSKTNFSKGNERTKWEKRMIQVYTFKIIASPRSNYIYCFKLIIGNINSEIIKFKEYII